MFCEADLNRLVSVWTDIDKNEQTAQAAGKWLSHGIMTYLNPHTTDVAFGNASVLINCGRAWEEVPYYHSLVQIGDALKPNSIFQDSFLEKDNHTLCDHLYDIYKGGIELAVIEIANKLPLYHETPKTWVHAISNILYVARSVKPDNLGPVLQMAWDDTKKAAPDLFADIRKKSPWVVEHEFIKTCHAVCNSGHGKDVSPFLQEMAQQARKSSSKDFKKNLPYIIKHALAPCLRACEL